jgi:hypothetical protein
VEALSETAKAEAAAVVCVLHQPRSAIFQRLDDLLLLASGRGLHSSTFLLKVSAFCGIGGCI